jgi:putative ABC transport system substrate-binding protein
MGRVTSIITRVILDPRACEVDAVFWGGHDTKAIEETRRPSPMFRVGSDRLSQVQNDGDSVKIIALILSVIYRRVEVAMNLLVSTPRHATKVFSILGLFVFCSATAAVADEKMWHVGLCHVGLDHVPPSVPALHQALNEMGYEDGKTLFFDWQNQADEGTAEATMKEWVAADVDLIVTFEDQCVRAARAATSEIPIVFVHAYDPVTSGYVESLAKPGGNLTGPVSNLALMQKRLELLKEIDPQLRRVLVLFDSTDPFVQTLERARQAAPQLGLELVERDAQTAADLERIFAELQPGEADAVIVASLDLMTNQSHSIIEHAEEAGLPLAGLRRNWAEWGALFAYGSDFPEAGRVTARYVDQILKGAKPADLPVEQLSRLVLTLNLKRAQELGITILPSIRLRADEVIE